MFKMVETNNIYQNLSATPLNDQQFRLNRISEIKNYFVAEIYKNVNYVGLCNLYIETETYRRLLLQYEKFCCSSFVA